MVHLRPTPPIHTLVFGRPAVSKKISILVTLQELRLLRHALAGGAEEKTLNYAQAMRRIGELQVAEWKAIEERQLRKKRERHSQRTKAGMEEQRSTGRPGPKGYTRAGRPRVEFDKEKAIALAAAGISYGQIALGCGVSKSTVQRFFKDRNKESGGAK